MSKSLKQQTISGMVWSSIGKFGTLGITFISNLVLARLLMPSDFGYIGMLYIFLAISQVFISGGLGSALIQKKETTHIDYTTVFYWNLVFSVFFVVLLFFTAQSIADFYKMPMLKDILRVQSIGLIISSFSIVQTTQLQKKLRFKELSVRSIIASFVGTIAAIVMAYNKFGVWSLVYSSLISGVVNVILLWNMSRWRPTLEFSFQSLKKLFGFGSLMLLSALVETIYTNIQGLIIGKAFSAKSLGFYTQARRLEEVPTSALSSIVNQVSFPVFSKIQNNKELLLIGVRKNIKAITFLNFPLMVLLLIIARPLFLFLYTQKWEASIPYFQILCVGAMLYTVNTINTNVIKSLGKSNIYFVVQFFKRLLGIMLIIFSIRYGIEAMLWSIVAVYYISFFINGYVSGKLIGYGVWRQVKDAGIYYLLAIIAGVITYCAFSFINIELSNLAQILLQITVYAFSYLSVSYILKLEGFMTYQEVVVEFLMKRKK
jgi:O-antigen/teichoic acid export membrane protein